MSLFKTSFFDYRSAEQKQADYEAYQQHMFPLGEQQRTWAANVLKGAPKPAGADKCAFGFYLCKEKYLESKRAGSSEQQCRQAAFRFLSKQRFLVGKANIPFLYAFTLLDIAATSEEDYPTIPQVQALQQQLFARDKASPDFNMPPA